MDVPNVACGNVNDNKGNDGKKRNTGTADCEKQVVAHKPALAVLCQNPCQLVCGVRRQRRDETLRDASETHSLSALDRGPLRVKPQYSDRRQPTCL